MVAMTEPFFDLLHGFGGLQGQSVLAQAWLAGRSAGFRQSQSSQCPELVAEASTSRQLRWFALLQPEGSRAVKDFEYKISSKILIFERTFFLRTKNGFRRITYRTHAWSKALSYKVNAVPPIQECPLPSSHVALLLPLLPAAGSGTSTVLCFALVVLPPLAARLRPAELPHHHPGPER